MPLNQSPVSPFKPGKPGRPSQKKNTCRSKAYFNEYHTFATG